MPNIKIQRTEIIILSERIKILAAAVLGVDLTVYLRLWGVLRIPARQINARSNRHPPDANRPMLEERRCG